MGYHTGDAPEEATVTPTYDVIVVGGGPAGSTAAREAAARGARVLLLDRATFPRDKPCGGGVNVRAAALLPFDLAPVVERTVYGAAFSLRGGRPFRRRYHRPLTYMTQRRRLDAFLLEQAERAGATVHQGEAVRTVEVNGAAEVRTDRGVYRGRTLVGADGANGVVRRALGLRPEPRAAVALEGNLPFPEGLPPAWQDCLALDVGGLPGGYAWVFPKGDHLNVGVGGWRWLGPTLRERLEAACRAWGLDPARLRDLRGHHLPLRAPGAPLVRGPALVAGDAAGLVDPLSGEGIYAAIYSGREAARAVTHYLAGRAPDLAPYQAAVERELGPDLRTSRALQDLFHRTPTPYYLFLSRSGWFWGQFCQVVRGETTYHAFARRLGPLRPALYAAAALARRGQRQS